MTFSDYQKQAIKTLVSSDSLMDKTILALGISGEAGEIAEKWKKIVAYHNGEITEGHIRQIEKEIGDVLWYLATFAHSLGISFEDAATHNITKLRSRTQRGTLKGYGDDR